MVPDHADVICYCMHSETQVLMALTEICLYQHADNFKTLNSKDSFRQRGAWAHLSLQDSFTVLIILKYLLVEFKHFGIVTTGFQVHRLQEQKV